MGLRVVAISRRCGCIQTGASPMCLPKSTRSPFEMDERIVPMIFTHRLEDGALDRPGLCNRDLHDLLLNHLA